MTILEDRHFVGDPLDLFHSVRYIDDKAYKWSDALARRAFYDSRFQWLDHITVGGEGGWCSDPSLVGNEWLDLHFSNSKGGYIYTGSKVFLPERR